jgi:hypothetical protein
MGHGAAALTGLGIWLLPGLASAQVVIDPSDQPAPAKPSGPLDLQQPVGVPPPAPPAPAPPPAAPRDAGKGESKAADASKEAPPKATSDAGPITPTSGSGFLITEGIGFLVPGIIGLAYPPGTPDPGVGFRHTAGATATVIGGLGLVGGIIWAGAVPSQHVTVHGSQYLIMLGTTFLITGTVMTINAGITAGVGVAGGCNGQCPSAQDSIKTAGTIGGVGGGALVAAGLIWAAAVGAFGGSEPTVSAARLVVGPEGVSGTF